MPAPKNPSMKHHKNNDAYERLWYTQTSNVDIVRRRLYLSTGVCEEIIHDLIVAVDRMQSESDEEITLLMNTGGGSFYDALALYDVLRAVKGPTTVVGLGSVMSAGAILLQAGKRRLIAPNCRFMIHHGSWNVGDAHASVVKAIGKEQEYNDNLYCRLLAERATIDTKEIDRLCEKETFMSATDAIKYGFADALFEGW